jgi:uncharacterized membrane protein YfcA
VHFDPALATAGLLVGALVGLTGMGGGALLTPILVLLFRVNPLTAISSDLLTSLVMKPVGGAVHLRERTVHWRLVGWLVLGSVPSAFVGAVVIGTLGRAAAVQDRLKLVIGIALCASVAMTLLRAAIDRRNARRDALAGIDPDLERPLVVRPLRTVVIGVIGGLAVGVTSVGAGSLIIAMLLLAYPTLRPSHLVGTDIVQAIPLVAAATLGHLIFGDVHLAITASLLIGALPGVYLGARMSARGPSGLIRPVISGVLFASALALLKAATPVIVIGALAAAGAVVALRPRRTARGTAPVVREPAAREFDQVH